MTLKPGVPVRLTMLFCLSLLTAWSSVFAENIDPLNDNSQFTYGENIGWLNWEPKYPPGPDVTDTDLTGYVWSENVGWISLSCSNTQSCATTAYGISNDGLGNLTGYGWGENVGWINFSPNNGGVSIHPTTGDFSGTAWGENIGWVTFSDTSPVAYKTTTSWASSPGTIAFSIANDSVNESEAVARIALTRTGGTGGAVSAFVYTTNGTASSGTDFTSSAGYVNWLNGVGGTQYFEVPITNDLEIEGNETFTVRISTTTGGAQLGTPSITTVSIIDEQNLITNGSFQSRDLRNWAVPAGTCFFPRTDGTASEQWAYIGDGGPFLATAACDINPDPDIFEYHAWIEQTVPIPASAGSAQLNLDYRVQQTDAEIYDWMRLFINGSQIASWWQDSGGWQPFTYDLSSYAGSNLTVRIESFTADSSVPVNYTVDNIRVDVTVPDIEITPLSYDFGAVEVGISSTPVPVTVTNNGTSDLSIPATGSLTFTGANASEFSVVAGSDTCSGATLPAAGICTFQIVFSPPVKGYPRTASLVVRSDDPDEPSFSVPLSGAGYSPQDTYYRVTEVPYQWEGTVTPDNRCFPPLYDAACTYSGLDLIMSRQLIRPLVFYDGGPYDFVHIDSQGHLWFDQSTSDYNINLIVPPYGGGPSPNRVVSLWNTDLNSEDFGSFDAEERILPDRLVVQWRTETTEDSCGGEGAGTCPTEERNDFEAVLFPDGHIRVDYQLFSCQSCGDSGSGISRGDGTNFISLTNNFGPVHTLAGRSFLYTPIAADLEVVTTPPPTPLVPDTLITYSVDVINNGPAEVTDVNFEQILPDLLENVEFSIDGGPWIPDPGRPVLLGLGAIFPGTSINVTFRGSLNRQAALTATFGSTASSPMPETNLLNNSFSEQLPINHLFVAWDGEAGPGDQTWHNPLNWNTDTVPGPGDDVIIGEAPLPAGPFVTYSSGFTSIGGLTLAGNAGLSVSGGNLTLHGASTAGVNTGIFLSGGDLASTGAATLQGSGYFVLENPSSTLWMDTDVTLDNFFWSSGIVSGNGTLRTNSQAYLDCGQWSAAAGSGECLLEVSWRNNGWVFWRTGDLYINQLGEFWNEGGGRFAIQTTSVADEVMGIGNFYNIGGQMDKRPPSTGNNTTIRRMFSNAGFIDVDTGTLTFSYLQSNTGMIDVAQGATFVTLGDGFANETGGVLSGTGTIDTTNGTFTNLGFYRPGHLSGDIGRLTHDGTAYMLMTSSYIDLEVAGDAGAGLAGGHDKLVINGPVGPTGTLNVTLNFTPSPGVPYAFDLLTAAPLSAGAFGTLNVSGVPLTHTWNIDYGVTTPNTVTLEITPNTVVSTDTNTLIDFYNATGGPNWVNRTRWLDSSVTVCAWHGVECNLFGTRVYGINLPNNNLTGALPATLPNLTNLLHLDVSHNHFAGPLPAMLGNVPFTDLSVRGNAFEGEIPASLVNLDGFDLASLDIGYNMLYTTDPTNAVQTFLQTYDPDWASTQTVAPTGPATGAITQDSIELIWTAIPYQGDTGYYEVCYGTTPGGPYPICRQTADKTVNRLVIDGLFPGANYYFVIRTVTNSHENNPNTLTSPFTNEVPGQVNADVYTYERMWPVDENLGARSLKSIATNNDGLVIAYNKAQKKIVKKTRRRKVVHSFGGIGVGPKEFLSDVRADFGPGGMIYTADTGNNRIQVFHGRGVTQWLGDKGGDGEQIANGFAGPVDVAAGVKAVYVADAGNTRIAVLNIKGTVERYLGDGNGPGDVNLETPVAVDLDAKGNVLVGESVGNRVRLLDALTGAQLQQWSLPAAPKAIDTDLYGITLALAGNEVFRLNPDGTHVSFDIQTGAGPGVIQSPTDIAADETGSYFYLADGEWIHRFLYSESRGVFAVPAIFAKSFTVGTDGDGHFRVPVGVAVDGAGRFLVADRENHRVQVFRPEPVGLDGTGNPIYDHVFETSFGTKGILPGQFNLPEGLAVDGDLVYISEAGNHRIQSFRRQGDGSYAYEDMFSGPGAAEGYLVEPKGLHTDGAGRLVIADSGNGRIQRLDPATGNISILTLPGALSGPEAIARDAAGNFYVTDTGNRRVVRYDTNWANPVALADDNVFLEPAGIVIEADGSIVVADRVLHKVIRLTPAGAPDSELGGLGELPGQFHEPVGLAQFADGSLLVSDSLLNRIQKFKHHQVLGGGAGGMFVPMVGALEGERSKAIILAGGGPYPTNTLWTATAANANYAYWVLTQQGFDKGSIFFLSDEPQDLDGNGLQDDVDAPVTEANLTDAILNWASDADHLLLYATDHGGTNVFRLNEHEVLEASVLTSLLDAIQTIIPGRVVLIYDACQGGNYVSAAASTTANRIVISSTGLNENAYWFAQGALSFSNLLWTEFLDGESVGAGFGTAALATQFVTGNAQNPQIHPTGGADPANVSIGNGTAAFDHATVFSSAGMAGSTLSVNVNDPDGVSQVWAVVVPPNYAPGSVAPDEAIRELDSFDLVPRGGSTYSREYTGFDQAGDYLIRIYAEDEDGRVSHASSPVPVQYTDGNVRRHKAVLFAADYSGVNPELQQVVEHAMGLAYGALSFQGLLDSDIHVIHPGGTAPSYFSGAPVFHGYTAGTLATSMPGWLGGNTADVAVYLFGDAASNGDFDLGQGATVSLGELNDAINAVQGETGENPVFVAYDAPYAGNLLSALSRASGEDVMVVSSTSSTEALPIATDPEAVDPLFATYSDFLWREILMGETVYSAWERGAAAVSALGGVQSPQIDDARGGQAARFFRIGRGTTLAQSGPAVASWIPDTVLGAGETSVTLWLDGVTTTGDPAGLDVRALEMPPGYVPPASGVDPALNTLPFAQVSPGRFEVSTGPLTMSGVYRYRILVRDDQGRLADPVEVQVCAGNCIDAYEDDDRHENAKLVVVNHPEDQWHSFHDPGGGSLDEDWVKMYAAAGVQYEITAVPDPDVNVRLELKGTNGTAPVAEKDDGTNGVPETLVWPGSNLPVEGTYYVRVSQGAGSRNGGADTGYRLRVTDGSGGTFTLVYGFVKTTGGVGIGGLRVHSEAEPGFYTFTDSTGFYSFSVSAGTGTRIMAAQTASFGAGNSASFTPGGAAQGVPDILLGPNSHTITSTRNGSGTVNPLGVVQVSDNGNQTFTVAPDAGHRLSSIELDSNPAPLANPYNLTNVTSNHSVVFTLTNDPPAAFARTVGVTEGGSVSGTLTGTDTESAALTFEKVSDPSLGVLTAFNTATGAFTYDLQGSNANGSDAFTFRVRDEGGQLSNNVATVTVNINPVNDPPVANPQSITADEYSVYNGTLTATDVDGPSLTYSIVSGQSGSHGLAAMTNPATGAFSYTPNEDTPGSDSFLFRASDGEWNSEAQVTVTINRKVRVDLEAGLNLFGYPVPVPGGYAASDLQAALGSQTIRAHNGSSYVTYPGTNFGITQGEGYLVTMGSGYSGMFDGVETCPANYDGVAGLNLVSLPCVSSGYTAYDLALHFGGSAFVSSVQRLNPETGLLETLAWDGSAWSGPRFPILPGEACMVFFHTDPPPVPAP